MEQAMMAYFEVDDNDDDLHQMLRIIIMMISTQFILIHVEQSSSSEADSHSAGQKILRILRKPEAH
jgi:hypothetical protein